MRNATIWVGLMLVAGAGFVPSAAADSASASAQVLIIIPDRRTTASHAQGPDTRHGDLFQAPQVPDNTEASVIREGGRTVIRYTQLPE